MTDGGSSLQFETNTGYVLMGQPWVFFSCHPESFDQLKDQVKCDVLKCCDCVFCWWDPHDTIPEALDDLSQMSLFVFAVDRRFIDEDCPSNTVLWHYAIGHHIPILPLIMEDGLILDFNDRFGELHTLLGFGSARQEKLKSYFDRLFVNNELANEIRNAFDAHLFLSYRKVDATEASKLIKAIRSLDYSRDIAIWFDAYLSPGEDFNEAIRSVLERCDLFVLLVTPNLIKEDNYVRREEFPRAQRSKRDILPVEMQSTNHETLQKWYVGIPSCVDGNQTSELSASLREHLDEDALGTNDDPRHLYCIGLAYLQGIDVEVDKRQAVSLIEDAAKGGLPDAMRAMQGMWRDGNGVEQDDREAAKWSERLARAMRPQDPLQDPKATLAYVEQLVDAAQAFADVRQVDDALALLDEGTSFVGPYADGQNRTLDLCMARLSGAAGSLLVEQGKNEQALGRYQRANECFRRCAEKQRDSKMLCRWADALFGMAHIIWKTRHTEQVRMLIEEALSYYREAYEQDHSYEAGFGAAECQYELCSYALGRSRQKEAVDHLEACGTMLNDVKSRHGEGRTLDELFNWHILVGDMSSVANNFEVALQAYKSAEKVILHINKNTMTILEHRYLQMVYGKIGNTYLELDNSDEAFLYFFPGYLAASEIESDLGDLQSKTDLEVFCYELGVITLERGDLDEAQTYIAKDIALAREVDRMAPTVDTRYSLGQSLCQLGLLRRAQKKPKQMNAAFKEAYDIFDKLDDDAEAGTTWFNGAAQNCLKLWDESSRELKPPEKPKRTQTPLMKRMSTMLGIVDVLVALAGIITHAVPPIQSLLVPAAAFLVISDIVNNLVLLDGGLTLLYLVFAAVGAGIALLFHASPLSGAAMGCCLVAFALNALHLYALAIVALARRGERD